MIQSSSLFKRFFKRGMFVALVLVLLTSALIITSPAGAQICTPNHIVRPGENLYRIGLTYGVSWVTLAQINGITNPSRILVGQVICLPGSIVVPTTPAPTTPAPGPFPYYPPPGVFPAISFNVRSATNGETIIIYGTRFPGNSTVDIFIAPRIPFGGTIYPATASGSAVVGPDGNLVTNFVVPNDVAGIPLRGQSYSVLVRARGSGYYGFNYFTNSRP